MSRGSSNKGNTRLTFANIAGTKKGEKVHITFKDAETKKNLPNDTGVGGYVSHMSVQTNDSKFGGTYETLKIYLEDPALGETVALSMTLNGVTKNIINALSSIEGPIGFIDISVSNDKGDYAVGFVKHNGENLKWAYKYTDLLPHFKEIKKVKKVNGRDVEDISSDYGDAFFLGLWNEKVMKLEKSGVPKDAKRVAPSEPLFADNQQEGKNEPVPEGADSSDDLPF